MTGRNPDHQAGLFQQGNEEALAFFFQQFHPALALYAFRWVQNRSIAEEIAADAFVKTWKMHWKLNSFPAIRAYLYKTVRRDSQLALKREKRRAEIHLQSQPPVVTNDTPFHQVIRHEVYRQVHEALKDLSPANRKVITMHFIDGKTTGEIAEELQLSASTIRNQKMGALIALRKKLVHPIFILFYLIVKIFLPFS
jgi:RNA polymerase sigma-70 factor (ECF subfamily)